MASPKTFIHSIRGFTLIEILVVMGLITIIFGLGLFFSLDDFRNYSFRNERDVIVASLHKARSQSINEMCFGTGCTDGKPHGVYLGTHGHYIIFQGNDYATRDVALDEDIKANDLSSTVTGATSVVFSNLSGNVSGTVSFTVTESNGHTSVITVEPEGRIWWTN